MMYLPSIFSNSFPDDDFEDSLFRMPAVFRNDTNMMKTDIKETDEGYEMSVELPGIKKEDIHADLKDGYLTISAERNENKDEKDSKGRYIRRERYTGKEERSFYVGDQLREDDVKAEFKDGILHLNIPKQEEKQQVEEKKHIMIG